MKNFLKYLMLTCVLAGGPVLFAADSTTKAQDKASKQTAEQAKPKRDWYPFSGIVASVDKKANTISLKKKEGERVLKLDANSALESDGKPITLGSVKVGNYAHGKLHKDAAGHEVITAAKFDKEQPLKVKDAPDEATAKKPSSKSKPQP